MKLHYCFLERFNNYFNRKIIKYSTLSDYQDHSKDDFIPVDGDGAMLPFDFNPNDNVLTEIIVNDVPFDPDYFLLLDDNENIVQRWFVLEQKRNRQGQWLYSLRRDAIADNFETLKFAPIYVNKGHLSEDDPMILNDEGLLFNQIKKSETPIKGQYGCAWVIGYMANSASASSVTGSPIGTPPSYTTFADIASDIGGNMTESDLTSALNGSTIEFNANNKTKFYYGVQRLNFAAAGAYTDLEHNGDGSLSNFNVKYIPSWWWDFPIGVKVDDLSPIGTTAQTYLNNNNSILLNCVLTYRGNKYFSYSQYEKLIKHNGDIVLYGGKYYKISIYGVQSALAHIEFNSKTGLLSAMTSSLGLESIKDNGLYYIEYNYDSITIQLDEYAVNTLHCDISGSHNTLSDATYSIFAIPYNTDEQFSYQGQYFTHIKGDQVLDIANAIARELGSNLYDLQLLPYCPLPLPGGQDWWDLSEPNWNPAINKDFDLIYDSSNTKRGVIYYLKVSKGSEFVGKSLSIKDSLKIDSQCRFYRIVSPNYNGVFEFNLAKNGGSSSGFYIDYTLRPYTPYIRVAPEFGLLYGTNYHDGRGLICGGDFSLPFMDNKWVDYQINNKNFNNIFNREIQNLEVTQRQERIMQYLQVGAGTIGGGAAGAITGAKAAGPWGAVAGAAIGLGAGAVGGAIDVTLGEERRKEQRDYAIDRFNYSLANIKALPESLAKNSAFTINNKIFPFIEFYEPTPQEVEALKSKIEYDGMTVNRIDTLNNFYEEGTPHYFKGQLIRNDEIADDPHTLNAIHEELLKGVYI